MLEEWDLKNKLDIDENLAKKEAAISSGFNFIFIIDKNYKEFRSLL